MNDNGAQVEPDFIELSADIVAAYVSHNAISPSDLPKLIEDVHAALNALIGTGVAPVAIEEQKPAIAIRKSITPEYLICLEDGEKFKSLKRHLRSHYNLSPEEYREKWGLPADYPMVAASYSATRSALAKTIGLGRKPGEKPAKKPRKSVA
ncbi:MAG TPA: MucR family transcriptional regulator [Arsenicitalea sp.]|nr:MucR family transcriptional regulator [Arsenicitalea sp.]